MQRCIKAPKTPLQHVNRITRSASSAVTPTLTHPYPYPNLYPYPSTPAPLHRARRQTRVISTATTAAAATQHHTSLQTFLTHARRTSLSPTSTTYQGTLYEYLAQTHLSERYGFELTRIGGRGDSGIDLQGTWGLAGAIRRAQRAQRAQQAQQVYSNENSETNNETNNDATRVLIQCKRLGPRSGGLPNLIRELEGAFTGAATGWRGDGVLGVMVCTRAATKGVRDAMGRSARGLVWVTMELGEDDDEDEDGAAAAAKVTDGYHVPGVRVVQFLYNAAAASRCGLEGVNVGVRYDDSGVATDLQLLWEGSPLHF